MVMSQSLTSGADTIDLVIHIGRMFESLPEESPKIKFLKLVQNLPTPLNVVREQHFSRKNRPQNTSPQNSCL